ncbi:carbonic anhydrase 2 [Lasioglossum baleicum]|uniref:carbonic anhydrase 2 n=1 Tax=Lasioglossum baleicum TaxID=434251 RepID=UPI003FCE3684
MRSSYIIFHVAVGLYVVGGAHWGYWGALDPEHWPGLCTNGKKQSPIDIVRENTVKKDLRPLEFLKYEHAATGVVANNGHTVEIRFSEDTFLLEGGELPATYVLDHIHFHWPSEHTVNGVHDAFEAHFVHYNNKYADLKAASQQEAGIAVVSTLYKLSDSDNMDLAPIVKAAKLVSQWGGPGSSKPKPVPLKSKMFPRQLLPKKNTTYYHYNGSLTTPECLETVMWYVLAGKRTISRQQLKVFESIETDNGTLAFNYRPTQVVGNRKVFYHLDEYSSVAMPTSNLFITLFSILIIELLCS